MDSPLPASIPDSVQPSYPSSAQKRPGYITHSNLVLMAFGTAFFPRVVSSLGIPVAINFLHFVTIPLVCGLILFRAKLKDPNQIALVKGLVLGLSMLLAGMIASALLNDAGVINVVLDFMLLAEPFLLILTLASFSMPPASLEVFRHRWLQFSLINLLFALCQTFVLHMDRQNADLVKGVFVSQGSGHVVGASVSMTFAVYYFITAKNRPLWARVAIAAATLIHIVKADAKQVIAVFLGAFLVSILLKAKSFGRVLQYLGIALLAVGFVAILATTVFRALLIWADWDVQQQGLALKLSAFSIVPTFYHSPWNWLLGMGPGHTVGRLGGWMIWEYMDLLEPLGVTTSRASVAVWTATRDSWLGDRSSWFSPLFGWAGIWGDLGFWGLGTYLSLWWVIWRRACFDDLSRYYVLVVFVFGLILSQIEEPGFMLFMAGIIGMRWQEHRNRALALRESDTSLQTIDVPYSQ